MASARVLVHVRRAGAGGAAAFGQVRGDRGGPGGQWGSVDRGGDGRETMQGRGSGHCSVVAFAVRGDSGRGVPVAVAVR